MYISDLSELQRVLHEMYEQLRDMRKENTYIICKFATDRQNNRFNTNVWTLGLVCTTPLCKHTVKHQHSANTNMCICTNQERSPKIIQTGCVD